MSFRETIYDLLEYPVVYNTLSRLTSVGRMKAIRFFEDKIRQAASGRVCDIGCGTGRYAYLVQSQYFGIDMNMKYLKTNRSNEHPVCGDATQLPFKDKSFDFIFSIGFFHHVDDRQVKESLNEICRTLAEGGRIIIVDILYPENRFNFLGYLLCRYDRGRYVRKEKDFEDILTGRFSIIESAYIKKSFPQNMWYYVIQPKGAIS